MARSIKYKEAIDARTRELAKELIKGRPYVNGSTFDTIVSISRNLMKETGLKVDENRVLLMEITSKEDKTIKCTLISSADEVDSSKITVVYGSNIIRFPKAIVQELNLTTKTKYFVRVNPKIQAIYISVISDAKFSKLTEKTKIQKRTVDYAPTRNTNKINATFVINTQNYEIVLPIEFKTKKLYGYTRRHVLYLEKIKSEFTKQTGTELGIPEVCGIWNYMSYCKPSKEKLPGRFNIPDENLSKEIDSFLNVKLPYLRMR